MKSKEMLSCRDCGRWGQILIRTLRCASILVVLVLLALPLHRSRQREPKLRGRDERQLWSTRDKRTHIPTFEPTFPSSEPPTEFPTTSFAPSKSNEPTLSPTAMLTESPSISMRPSSMASEESASNKPILTEEADLEASLEPTELPTIELTPDHTFLATVEATDNMSLTDQPILSPPSPVPFGESRQDGLYLEPTTFDPAPCPEDRDTAREYFYIFFEKFDTSIVSDSFLEDAFRSAYNKGYNADYCEPRVIRVRRVKVSDLSQQRQDVSESLLLNTERIEFLVTFEQYGDSELFTTPINRAIFVSALNEIFSLGNSPIYALNVKKSPVPTEAPAFEPTQEPTSLASLELTEEPTELTGKRDALYPSFGPTDSPVTYEPTGPSRELPLTDDPTPTPTSRETERTTKSPTHYPTDILENPLPSSNPIGGRSPRPTSPLTRRPTREPRPDPTAATEPPTWQSTDMPTSEPTPDPTAATEPPTWQPTDMPTSEPTATEPPTRQPTDMPTPEPTATDPPTSQATDMPTSEPTATEPPASQATDMPTSEPTFEPTTMPSWALTSLSLSAPPAGSPSRSPTIEPTEDLSSPLPTQSPRDYPSLNPTGPLSAYPSDSPEYILQETQLKDTQMFLNGVSLLSSRSQIVWKEATENAIEREVLWILKDTAESVDVEVANISQDPNRRMLQGTSTIIFSNLTITFDVQFLIRAVIEDHNVLRYVGAALDTIEDQDMFIAELKASEERAFRNLTSVRLSLPATAKMIIENPIHAEEGTPESRNTGMAIGITSATIAVIALSGVGVFAFMKRTSSSTEISSDQAKTLRQLNGSSAAGFDVTEKPDVEVSTLGDPIPQGITPVAGDASLAEESASLPYDYKVASNILPSLVDNEDEDNSSYSSFSQPSSNIIEVETDDDELDAQYFIEDQIEVEAPPGMLGLVLEADSEGVASVCNMREKSPLAKRVHLGDILLAVDGRDVTAMPVNEVMLLIAAKKRNKTRKLKFRRPSKKSAHRENLAEPANGLRKYAPY